MYLVDLKVHHDCWSSPTERMGDINLNLMDASVLRNEDARGLIKVNGSKDEIKEFTRKIRAHPYIKYVKRFDQFLSVIVKEDGYIADIFLRNQCILMSKCYMKEGMENWRMFSFTKSNTNSVISELKEVAEVIKTSTRKFRTPKLTKKEKQAYHMAVKKGYFDVPKKITIEELALELEIKKSAMAERLQRAQKKIHDRFLQCPELLDI